MDNLGATVSSLDLLSQDVLRVRLHCDQTLSFLLDGVKQGNLSDGSNASEFADWTTTEAVPAKFSSQLCGHPRIEVSPRAAGSSFSRLKRARQPGSKTAETDTD